MDTRYEIHFISVGDAGLTQRPAIFDTYLGRMIYVMNKDHKHGEPTKVIDYWTDGHGIIQFKLLMVDGYMKVTHRKA